MKSIITILLLFTTLIITAKPVFLPKQLVTWQEVNIAGQRITQVGMILSRDLNGTYRILAKDGWKMHLHKSVLTKVKK
jgi:hypothetical protein